MKNVSHSPGATDALTWKEPQPCPSHDSHVPVPMPTGQDQEYSCMNKRAALCTNYCYPKVLFPVMLYFKIYQKEPTDKQLLHFQINLLKV
jgi:hypothetical protein